MAPEFVEERLALCVGCNVDGAQALLAHNRLEHRNDVVGLGPRVRWGEDKTEVPNENVGEKKRNDSDKQFDEAKSEDAGVRRERRIE